MTRLRGFFRAGILPFLRLGCTGSEYQGDSRLPSQKDCSLCHQRVCLYASLPGVGRLMQPMKLRVKGTTSHRLSETSATGSSQVDLGALVEWDIRSGRRNDVTVCGVPLTGDEQS